MRTAIFTSNLSNYGALLQAYSIQKTIEEITGGEAVQIDLSSPNASAWQNLFEAGFGHLRPNCVARQKEGGSLPVRCIIFLLKVFYYRSLKKKWNSIVSFRKDYLHLIKNCPKSLAAFRNTPPQADLYLVGSDQVFNPQAPLRDIYFLNFPIPSNTHCIAYAASFGTSIFTRQDESELKPFLQKFSFLSSREESGAVWLRKVTGKDVPTLLDPVFLTSTDHWKQIAIYPARPKESYIFVYDLNGGSPLLEIAHQLSEKMGLPVVCQTEKTYKRYPAVKIFDCGPRELIGYIANAAYIVTDSFHGTAFSLLFRRNFLSYIAIEKSQERITGLLDSLGMSDHILYKPFIFSNYNNLSALNELQFGQMKENAICWLKNSLQSIQNSANLKV